MVCCRLMPGSKKRPKAEVRVGVTVGGLRTRFGNELLKVVILGDPGPVGRAGRKGATKAFKHRRQSPWVKRMLAPDWEQKLLCIIVPNRGEQFLLSSFRGFVHDGYCLATLARFVHQACAYKGNFYFLLS